LARILIVDDEASLRDSLKRTLERDGHETVMAADLRSGRRELAEGGFDLLISDIRLGDGSGLDLIADARQASAALRIVALTAYGSVELAVEAMRRGADDFLEKPFRPDVLRSHLERALEPAWRGSSARTSSCVRSSPAMTVRRRSSAARPGW
jgi:DNA-binding NtrC family response regulator